MPVITTPKDKIKTQEPVPPGIYDFVIKEFHPETAKKGGSTNLNPWLRIVNHPTLNDRSPAYENLNSQAYWVHVDLAHAMGLTTDDGSGGVQLPGKFICKSHGDSNCQCDPKEWLYQGGLIGPVGKLEVALAPNGKGGVTTKVKRYICAVPGCTEKHRESLL